MTEQTFTAVMANSSGRWHVYVELPGEVLTAWPEHNWDRTTPTPTPAERTAVLAALGYEIPPDCEWQWTESGTVLEGATEPVALITAVTVRPLGGAA